MQQSGQPQQTPAQNPEQTPQQQQVPAQAPAPEKQEPVDLTMNPAAAPAKEEPAAPAKPDATPATEAAPVQLETPAEAKPKADDMNTYIYETLAQGDAAAGKAHFNTLATWCAANMDKGELATINYLLKSDNKDVVRQGLTQAVTAWRKAQKQPMMTGDAIPTNMPQEQPTFEPLQRDEFIQIQMTDKYNSDPAYAKEVDDRRRKTIDMHGKGFVSPEYSASRMPIR